MAWSPENAFSRPAGWTTRPSLRRDVEAFASTIDRKDWGRLPARVARNTERLLDILADAETKATFFVLGWIARRHPALVKRVAVARHKLASHGSDLKSQQPVARGFSCRCAPKQTHSRGSIVMAFVMSEPIRFDGSAISEGTAEHCPAGARRSGPVDVLTPVRLECTLLQSRSLV